MSTVQKETKKALALEEAFHTFHLSFFFVSLAAKKEGGIELVAIFNLTTMCYYTLCTVSLHSHLIIQEIQNRTTNKNPETTYSPKSFIETNKLIS